MAELMGTLVVFSFHVQKMPFYALGSSGQSSRCTFTSVFTVDVLAALPLSSRRVLVLWPLGHNWGSCPLA